MQKKICLMLLGYMLVLSAAGIWLTVHRRLESLPALEKAVLEEILTTGEDGSNVLEGTGKSGSSGSGSDLSQYSGSADYWENYRNSQNNQEQMDPNTILSRLKNANISSADKMKVLYILKKNLTGEDISFIVSLVKDGITSDEKKEIKALLQRKIGAEDQKELKAVVAKYL